MDPLRTAFGLPVIAIGTLLVFATAATASPVWLSSEARSTAGDTYVQGQSWNPAGDSIATNARGDAVIAWHRLAGFDGGTVQSALHRAGAPPTTSPLLNVSPNDYNPSTGTGTRTGGSEAVTLDDAGNAYVFYSVQGSDGFRDLVYRRAPPGTSDWGPVTVLVNATSAGNEATGIVAANNPSGQIVLYAFAGVTRTFIGSPDGTFTDAGGLGTSSGAERLVINDAGDAAMTRFNLSAPPYYNRIVNTIFRPRGGPWQSGTTRDASTTTDADPPDIGIGGDGTVMTVWVEPGADHGGGVRYKQVWYVTRPRAGPVSNPTALSIDGIDSTSPSIAMNESGEAIIAYQEGAGNILIKRRAPNGDISSLGYVPDPDPFATSFTSPRVALNDAGDAVVVYTATVAGKQVVRAVRRPAGQTVFKSPTTLSPNNSSAGDVVVGRFGDAFAGFAMTPTVGQQQIVVRSAGFDNSGPHLENINFPSTAFNNTGFGYSVDAVDAWSPIASTQWTFGDGGSASGPSGTKAYAANGTYTATISATDAPGNGVATASRDVTVTDVPPPPSPGGGQGPSGEPAPGGATALAALTGLLAKPKSFLAATSGPSVAKATRGTVVSYTDTQTARSTFTVQRPSRGYKKGRKCVKRKPRGVRKPKRCTIYKAVKGSFVHEDIAGPNSLRFTGRLGGKTLKPGRYRLTAVAGNSFGTSKALRTNFTVKKPRRRKR